jgi:hypothetical protein
VRKYSKYDKLRQKLLSGEPLNADEATGDTVSRMLKEIDGMNNINNPYNLSCTEVQHSIEKLTEHMGEIRRNLERMWSGMKFRNQTVSVSDAAYISE